MRIRRIIAVGTVLALIAIPAASAVAADGDDASGELSWLAQALGRQALPANDGWAADGTGTTGGSTADADHVFVAHSRAELVAALGGNNATNKTNATPKIVFIAGTINGFEGPDGALLSCADLADPAFTLDAYLATYDPAVWGRVNPSGPLEDARVRSTSNQTKQTQINVGPNTTIFGLHGATMLNLTLMLDGASNSIVRNITFNDGRDCFPQWSPTDGATGNWNSQFDNASVRRSTNVWFDHNTFTDGDDPDSSQPVYFGRPFQWHDGNLDITHTSSLVTVSFNRFTNHDKVMLIGSSNTVGPDDGRLNVTLHHNMFDGVNQRLPRVRFGKVDVYNNAYRLAEPFDYALGVGVQSAIVAENNFFTLDEGVAVEDILHDWGGTVITESGTWARLSDGRVQRIGLLDAYNATHDPDFTADAGWTPVLRAGLVLPAPAVPIVVALFAGAGRLPV